MPPLPALSANEVAKATPMGLIRTVGLSIDEFSGAM